MPELQYKFKSSLSFETIKLSDNKITVGELKDLINKKQSIKTNGFDLKLKDSEGKVYVEDDEIVDIKQRILVSRFPKLIKQANNVKKKETVTSVPKDVQSPPKPIAIPESKMKAPTSQTSVIKDDEKKPILNVPNLEAATTVTEATPDILQCYLCKKTMKNATRINCCGKNFCYECITGYLFDPDVSGAMECPHCKSAVSNNEANITGNLQIRGIISERDRAVTEVHEVEVDIPVQQVDITTSSLPPDEIDLRADDAHVCDQHKARENVVMAEVSDIPQVPDVPYHNQIETHPPEREMRPITNEVVITPAVMAPVADKPVSVPVPVVSKRPSKEEKVVTATTPAKSSSVSKSTAPSDVSIRSIDFDPVLYMKFLKIVGERFPDELRRILSGSGGGSGGNGDDGSSGGRRVRAEDGPGGKRARREDGHRWTAPETAPARRANGQASVSMATAPTGERRPHRSRSREGRPSRDQPSSRYHRDSGKAPMSSSSSSSKYARRSDR